jgi:hypothetical protein
VYGCTGAKQYRLGNATNCPRAALVRPVTVAGAVAAYGLEQCGVDTGSTEVIVRSLSSGKQLSADAATTGLQRPESYQAVGSLVLKGDGAVAWIAEAHSIVGGGQLIEVHRHGRLLDSGPAIALGSLRLRGSRLSWRHGSKIRTSTLS